MDEGAAAEGGWFSGVDPELQRWLYSVLEQAGHPSELPVGELFADGVALARLISQLTGQPVKVKSKAKLVPIQLDNLAVCCARMAELGVETPPGLSPADFHSGNQKAISGFLTKLANQFPDQDYASNRSEQRAQKSRQIQQTKQQQLDQERSRAEQALTEADQARQAARKAHLENKSSSTKVQASRTEWEAAERAAEEQRQQLILESQEQVAAAREEARERIAQADREEEAARREALKAEEEAAAQAAADAAKAAAEAEAAAKAAAKAQAEAQAAAEADRAVKELAAREAEQWAQAAEAARLAKQQADREAAERAEAKRAAEAKQQAEKAKAEAWTNEFRSRVLNKSTSAAAEGSELVEHQRMALSELWDAAPERGRVSKGTKLDKWPGVGMDRTKQFVERITINNGGLTGLPEAVVLLAPTLRELNLNRNGLATVPRVLGTLQQLRELDMNGANGRPAPTEQAAGNDLESLPPEIGRLKVESKPRELTVMAGTQGAISECQ